METLNQILAVAQEYAVEWVPKLGTALVVLIIGLWVIKLVNKAVKKLFEKKDFDPSLEGFLGSLISMLLKALLAITVISMLGIEMTSFVALLGAAGLAIGMAMSGTLQNFAGGVMLLIFKPYKVGDFIETEGFSGTVDQIQIFNTIMTTPDNKQIIVPNSPIATNSIVNYSTRGTRRCDFTIGIGYDDDIDQAKEVIMGVITSDERVFSEPAPFIAVKELADSSVNFTLRVWCNGSDYWGIYFDNLEAIKKALDKAEISIPYPQRDVHVHHVDGNKSEDK